VVGWCPRLGAAAVGGDSRAPGERRTLMRVSVLATFRPHPFEVDVQPATIPITGPVQLQEKV
jgi:hypothetical protein